MPSPMPPSTPVPSQRIQSWCRWMPSAPSTNPPAQQQAETRPALRGPTRSSQPPQIAADKPRKKMNRVNTQFSSLTFQSQLVVNSAFSNPASGAQARGLSMPMARDSGSQNTLNP